MCLIAFAWHAHPRFALILAANRDEFHERPTAAAGWWPHRRDILGGRDLRAGGSWMGLTRAGRFATLTNVRDPLGPRPGDRSRGTLVQDFLEGSGSAAQTFAAIDGQQYAGFNLLLMHWRDAQARATMGWMSNRADDAGGVRWLPPGVYGLSNHLLDTPWAKVRHLKSVIADAMSMQRAADLEACLFEGLASRERAPEAELIAPADWRERERELSCAFIAAPHYGTRASTVILIGHDGGVRYLERSWAPCAPESPGVWSERRAEFRLDQPAGRPASH